MNFYAMVLNNKVIGVTESEELPVFPPTLDGYKVETVKCGRFAQVGDYVENGKVVETGAAEVPSPMEQDLLIEKITQIENILKQVEEIVTPIITDEPTQVDKIEANLDYLVMLNS